MGLRCSLLGHEYGETELEREREERGSEVVVTVREYEECTRCGEQRIVSESTEVTSTTDAPGPEREAEAGFEETAFETAAVDETDEGGAEPPEKTEPGDGDADVAPTDVEPPDTGAEILTDEPTEDAEVASPDEDSPADGDGSVPDDDTTTVEGEATPDEGATADDAEVLTDDAGATADDPAGSEDVEPTADEATIDDAVTDDPLTGEDGEPITDDAEIIDDDPETTIDRQRGEWPPSEDVGPPAADAEPSVWPDSDEPTGGDGDASSETGGGIFIDDAVDAEAGTDRAASSTATESGSGIASAQSAPAPGEGGVGDGAATEFFCPQCEFVAAGDRGSLRAGDICPECQKGYLGERERQR